MKDFNEILISFFTVVGVLIVFPLILGFPVMWLWNIVMPELFGLSTINFWTALALNLLCSFLFKSTGGKKNE